MPPQPSLPESRSRGFRHSSSYGHTVLCPNRKTYSSLRLLSLLHQEFSHVLKLSSEETILYIRKKLSV